MIRFILGVLIIAITGCSATKPVTQSVNRPISSESVFGRFAPNPSNEITIDYKPIDTLLRSYVFVSGPSIRRRLQAPRKPTGTNMFYGHTSPIRLEGNKVEFDKFTNKVKHNIRTIVDNLVQVANQNDLTQSSKNEQLAFWFNLHNMLVVRELSQRYPTRYPSKIIMDDKGTLLDDAKLVTIRGVALSLSDIRNNIVYRHWQDPLVFYGFFHGDLASPNIRNSAYTGKNVYDGLKANAKEFVNSLRGIEQTFGDTKISPLYKEAQTYLFPQWPKDFRSHIEELASEKVENIINNTDEFLLAKRETRISDLMGGQSVPVHRIVDIISGKEIFNYNRMNFKREFEIKLNLLLKQGKLGTVEITDLPAEN